MFELVRSFQFEVPSETDIRFRKTILTAFCENMQMKMRKKHRKFRPPIINQAPELVPEQVLNVSLFRKGEASVDECLAFLLEQGAVLVGTLGIALFVHELPVGCYCYSFATEDLNCEATSDAPWFIFVINEGEDDVSFAFSPRNRMWEDADDCFVLVTLADE